MAPAIWVWSVILNVPVGDGGLETASSAGCMAEVDSTGMSQVICVMLSGETTVVVVAVCAFCRDSASAPTAGVKVASETASVVAGSTVVEAAGHRALRPCEDEGPTTVSVVALPFGSLLMRSWSAMSRT